MKKAYSIFYYSFCLFLLALLCACGKSQTTTTEASDEKEMASDSKDDSGKTDLFGDWFVEDYVDDFGDSTGSCFCYSICEGTFDNTATSNSDLIAGVYYDQDQGTFQIRLLEYKKTKATYLSTSEISMKCKVGAFVFEDTPLGDAPNGDLTIYKTQNAYDHLYDNLSKGKEIRTVIYIDNSKYSFSISGNGFSEAIEEQKHRQELKGISGTYRNTFYADKEDTKYADWFVINQETDTSGTITKASSTGSGTAEYTYDPSTYILTVNKTTQEWTYRCVYKQFLVHDGVVVAIDGTTEGIIPEGETFNTTIKWSSNDNKATSIYEFKKDGSLIESGTDYKGNEVEQEKFSYKAVGSFIFIFNRNGRVQTVCYVLDGKMYGAISRPAYIIDK